MSTPIAPLEEADLPQRQKAFWKLTGPGAVLVGLSIGAGELVIWPWVTAKFGASMAWAAALGVFLQLWINIEIGRWAIATGESLYTGYARLWRGFVGTFIFINFILFFLPGWARASGVALKALLFGPAGPGPDWLWTAVTFAAIAVVLFGPRTIYTAVERSVSFLVVIIVVGLVIVAARVGTHETLVELVRGLLNFGHIELDDEFPFHRFFSAVVFAGAGGVTNLYYAFYLRDKEIGMGARMSKLSNPLRGRAEARVDTGYIFPDNDENRRRFRDWLRYVVLDQTLYFWLLNSLTMLLFIFGALAVLHPAGLVPAEGRLVWDLAVILEGSMGSAGRQLFLVIGMAALFSTQLTLIDGGARTLADLVHTNFRLARKASQSQWYLWLVLSAMIFGVASTWFLERFQVTALGFFFNSALISGFAMAIYTPATLYLNMKYLPRSARPGPVNVVMVALGAAVYGGFALYTLWVMVIS